MTSIRTVEAGMPVRVSQGETTVEGSVRAVGRFPVDVHWIEVVDGSGTVHRFEELAHPIVTDDLSGVTVDRLDDPS